ncbi:hypothetical protein GOP47_0009830 [Adiantum capillus-veneris]|uniref:Uncharacterized protein n=1 Tax=Adiantum capillus-veneris TaxID=13818 RepID=A0A9D4UXC3_ADICA|nr:hypothetical protein GOP47_0009830 [Adiantum capillus-veneris]
MAMNTAFDLRICVFDTLTELRDDPLPREDCTHTNSKDPTTTNENHREKGKDKPTSLEENVQPPPSPNEQTRGYSSGAQSSDSDDEIIIDSQVQNMNQSQAQPQAQGDHQMFIEELEHHDNLARQMLASAQVQSEDIQLAQEENQNPQRPGSSNSKGKKDKASYT